MCYLCYSRMMDHKSSVWRSYGALKLDDFASVLFAEQLLFNNSGSLGISRAAPIGAVPIFIRGREASHLHSP